MAIGLQNLTEGTKNPLSEYNTAFRRLQMWRRMTPVTDLPTQQSPTPAEPSTLQFETNVDNGTSTRLDSTLENPKSAAEKTDTQTLTEDPQFMEFEASEENIENLAGLLDDFYNDETLPRLSKLDVAFEMDEVEIIEDEPWDDNDSDSDVDSGASDDEREWRSVW